MGFKDVLLKLNEMIVSGIEKSGSTVIAFNKWIYILNPKDNNKKLYKEILDNMLDLFSDLEERYPKGYFESMNLNTLINIIKKNVFDAFVGFIDGKNLIVDMKYQMDFKTSNLIFKVMKQLNLDNLVTPKDFENFETIEKKNISNSIPQIGYHGTTSDNLESILQYGLIPKSGSNWGKNSTNQFYFSLPIKSNRYFMLSGVIKPNPEKFFQY